MALRDFFSYLRAGLHFAGDMVLPPRCLLCDQPVAVQGALCASCWCDVPFVERPFCACYGTPLPHDLGAEGLSARALVEMPVFGKSRVVTLYEAKAREMVLALKFSSRRELVRPMGQWMARAGSEILRHDSLLVPVPLHRFRLWQRRFNQAAELAKEIADVHGCETGSFILERVRRTRQQVGLDAKMREKNVRSAFRVRDEALMAIQARHIVLIDDVITTGSTVSACTKTLLKAGAGTVDVLAFSQALPDAVSL